MQREMLHKFAGRLLWLAAFVIGFGFAELHADTLFLKNGEILEGSVAGQGRTVVHFRLADGTVRTVRKSDIARLRFGPSPAEQEAARKRAEAEQLQRLEAERRRAEAERRRRLEAERRAREKAEAEQRIREKAEAERRRKEAAAERARIIRERRAARQAREQFREEQRAAREAAERHRRKLAAEQEKREREAAEAAARQARTKFEEEQRLAREERDRLTRKEQEERETAGPARALELDALLLDSNAGLAGRSALELRADLRRTRADASLLDGPYQEFFPAATALESARTGLPFAELFSPLEQRPTRGLGLGALYERSAWFADLDLTADSARLHRGYLRRIKQSDFDTGRLARFDAEWSRSDSRLALGYDFLQSANATNGDASNAEGWSLGVFLGVQGAEESAVYSGGFGARTLIQSPVGVLQVGGLGFAALWEDRLEEGGGHLGLRARWQFRPDWELRARLRLGSSEGEMQIAPTLWEARLPQFRSEAQRYLWPNQTYTRRFSELELELRYRLNETLQLSVGMARSRSRAEFAASPVYLLFSSGENDVSFALPHEKQMTRTAFTLGCRYRLDFAAAP